MLTFPRPTNAGIALPTHQSIHNNQNAERSFPELSTMITPREPHRPRDHNSVHLEVQVS